MKLSLEENLNRIDSKELFSQLVGRIVINHEHLNSLVRDLVYLLFRDLATFSRTHMHDLPEDLASASPKKVNEKLIASHSSLSLSFFFQAANPSMHWGRKTPQLMSRQKCLTASE